MKKFTKAIAAIMLMTAVCFVVGCTKPDDPNNDGNDSPIATNVVNGSIEGGFDFSGLSVETMYDKVALNGKDFAVEVADSDIPQFIAVTDADINCYMLYRGRLDKNVPVVIDANSTALAMVTMHPVLGPMVKANEYSQLMGIIESNSHFNELKQGVASAIAAKRPVSDTTNREIMDALFGFFEELTALTGLDSISGRGDISDYLNSYPMKVTTEGNTVTMRVTVLSPSYYGTVTDENGHSENIRVLTRADYGFLDAFTHTVENMDWADPTHFTFHNSGNFNFEFSKNSAEAQTDYYLHLANSIAGTLGLDLDNHMIDALSDQIAVAIEAQQGNVGDDGMRLVGMVYQGVVNYLSDPQANNGIWTNWQLAGRMLRSLTGIYNVVKGACNAMLRVAYFMEAPNDIDFCLEYHANSGINPCSETTVTIVGGNNQIGFMYETLPLPLEVYVTSQTDNGWSIHPDYVVRFSMVSGGGELAQDDVVVDENHKASTRWTLGEQGEQKVSAVVVDPETGEELSNKVYFVATFNEGFVTTIPITDITQTSAKCGGIIADDAMTYVTRCGVCWNTSGAPTIDDNQVFTSPGTGTFHCNITGLMPNTTYHVRAFAKIGYEYYYGNELTFATEEEPCECNLTEGDWVDLGLPSGLLWATRNVGASSPEDYGDYFAWGETSPKSYYDWDTYQYYTCGVCGNYNHVCGVTKYCNNDYQGFCDYHDNLTTLQPGDDAATASYGGRMPTKEEWEELYNNTTNQWVTINGVNGRCFTGPNGNGLFLPTAGNRYESSLYNAGSYGYYWSSSLYTDHPYNAWRLHFNSGNCSMYSYGIRDCGHSVRPVRSARQK